MYIYKYVSISIYKNTHAYLLLDILTYIYDIFVVVFIHSFDPKIYYK